MSNISKDQRDQEELEALRRREPDDPAWDTPSNIAVEATTVPPEGLPQRAPFAWPEFDSLLSPQAEAQAGSEPWDPELLALVKDMVQTSAIAEFLAPDAHSNPGLMAFAKPKTRDAYNQALATAKADAEQNIRVAMSMLAGGEWPTIDDCIPKGSLLDEIDRAFFETTDIPRELPMFAALHYVSALLLQRHVGIAVAGEVWRPDIWTICLAESGSGKSFASSRIGKALGGVVKMFPDSDSAAKFAEDLRDHNRGLWMRDEFAQFLKALGAGDSMAAIKDYLLRCYDGSKIVRSTKAETIEVAEPALTIFGSTVFSTIKDYLTREMLEDGFAQRFAYVVAERDPERPLRALYDFAERAPEITASWQAIAAGGLRERYTVDAVARAAFEEGFQLLLKRGLAQDLELSFIKRITHRGVKYALIYHVLLGKTSERLDAEDFAYAARLCALSMRDLRKVLDLYGEGGKGKGAPPPPPPTPEEKAARVADFLAALRDVDGAPMDVRTLMPKIRRLRGTTAEEVRGYMQAAVDADPTLAKYAILPKAKPQPKAAPAKSPEDGQAQP